VVKTWTIPPPDTVDAEKVITAGGPYVPLKEMSFQSAYPVLQGYKEFVGLGYHVHIDDPLSIATIGITAAYTPSKDLPSSERAHVDVDYRYLGWHAGASWNRSDFYDLFGRPSAAAAASPRAAATTTRWSSTSPAGSTSAPTWPSTTTSTPCRLAEYPRDRRAPRHRRRGPLLHRHAPVARRRRRRERGVASWWPRQLRRPPGHAPGARATRPGLPAADGALVAVAAQRRRFRSGAADDPYANFYFGGFGNNYVDRGKAKRYRSTTRSRASS
jgi:hypothetical protein